MTQATKICFVIAPIGKDGSEERLRSDQVLNHIVGPAARECGYEPVRADNLSEPGIITSQVIQHIVDDPLVVADLTGRNPNVFYELAVRHAVRMPVVQIIQASETIPFDVAASRTIQVDHHDLDSVARARTEIVRQIRAAVRNPREVDSPISAAVELQSLRRSDNPVEKSNAEILSMLQALAGRVAELTARIADGPPRVHPLALEDLLDSAAGLSRMVNEGRLALPPELADAAEKYLLRLRRAADYLAGAVFERPDVYGRRVRFPRAPDEPRP